MRKPQETLSGFRSDFNFLDIARIGFFGLAFSFRERSDRSDRR
jgi:hypothetical protein